MYFITAKVKSCAIQDVYCTVCPNIRSTLPLQTKPVDRHYCSACQECVEVGVMDCGDGAGWAPVIARQSRHSKSLFDLAEMTSEPAALWERERIPELWLPTIPGKRARNLSVHGKVRK